MATNILRDPQGPIKEWQVFLATIISEYIDRLKGNLGNPFLDNPPKEWKLISWANVLEADGYQGPHCHEKGWVSGTYYVKVPPTISPDAANKDGKIFFGPGDDEFPLTGKIKAHWIIPKEGTFIIFPSYLYHQTVPSRSAEHRVAISYDVSPLA